MDKPTLTPKKGFLLAGAVLALMVGKSLFIDPTPEALPPPIPTTTTPIESTPTHFDDLVQAREAARESTEAVMNRRPLPTPHLDVQVVSVMDQAREKLKLAEFRRAKLASISAWGPPSRAVSAPQRAPLTATPSATQEHLLSTDEQRLAISRKLSKLNELKAKIQAGNYSVGDAA